MCFAEVMQLVSLSHCERSLTTLTKAFLFVSTLSLLLRPTLQMLCLSLLVSALSPQSLFSVEVVVLVEFLFQYLIFIVVHIPLRFRASVISCPVQCAVGVCHCVTSFASFCSLFCPHLLSFLFLFVSRC